MNTFSYRSGLISNCTLWFVGCEKHSSWWEKGENHSTPSPEWTELSKDIFLSLFEGGYVMPSFLAAHLLDIFLYWIWKQVSGGAINFISHRILIVSTWSTTATKEYCLCTKSTIWNTIVGVDLPRITSFAKSLKTVQSFFWTDLFYYGRGEAIMASVIITYLIFISMFLP